MCFFFDLTETKKGDSSQMLWRGELKEVKINIPVRTLTTLFTRTKGKFSWFTALFDELNNNVQCIPKLQDRLMLSSQKWYTN